MSRITELPELIDALPPAERAWARALFDVSVTTGSLTVPPELDAWLVDHFGSVAAVEEQQVVRVTDRQTLNGAIFSPLRTRRPQAPSSQSAFRRLVESTMGDEFCHPETGTPADTWGRVRGRRTITAANAAKYEGRHGVVILDQHDPLAFDAETIVDVLDVGREWAERGRAEDAEASAYLLIWNGGPRAGGSIVHGHAQVTLGHRHYPYVERACRAAASYAEGTGRSYFGDGVAVHRALGLVVAEADGVTTLATLTPVKERELLVIGQPGMDEREPAFAGAVTDALLAYRDVLGVRAFDLALHRAPIDDSRALAEGWSAMPPTVHLVDRGDPDSASSDIGAMELYAAPVVGADPFGVVAALREGRSR
ncbi:MAG TPA: hypothetical protein VFY43_04220 [Candidatus Limnocylindria bacterium]|nr:hypothetical protein [Candidatus Limnocylindria bacterium]